MERYFRPSNRKIGRSPLNRSVPFLLEFNERTVSIFEVALVPSATTATPPVVTVPRSRLQFYERTLPRRPARGERQHGPMPPVKRRVIRYIFINDATYTLGRVVSGARSFSFRPTVPFAHDALILFRSSDTRGRPRPLINSRNDDGVR